MSIEPFDQLRTALAELEIPLTQLQRVRRLMRACQVSTMTSSGRRLSLSAEGLSVVGDRPEGMLMVLDHPIAAGQDITTCRHCGCTDLQPRFVDGVASTWRVKHADGTGLCNHCDDAGPQLALIDHNRWMRVL